MRITRFLALFLLLTTGLLSQSGCSDDVASGPEYPKGTMTGRVMLIDTAGQQISGEGVVVTLEGTTLSTTTDARGEWKIEDVPTRTYNVRYDKEGFGYSKHTSVVFVGGGVMRLPQIYLYPIPECGAFFDVLRQVDTNIFEMYAHAGCSSGLMFGGDILVFYLSNSRDVSSTPGKFTAQIAAQSHIPGGSAGGMYMFSQFGLNMNDSIYVVAYHAGGQSGYYDPLTGEFVYTAIYPEPSRVLAIKAER